MGKIRGIDMMIKYKAKISTGEISLKGEMKYYRSYILRRQVKNKTLESATTIVILR